MKKCVSDENLMKIVETYKSGFTSLKGIAGKLELDKSTVCRTLQYAHEKGMIKYIPEKHGIKYL